MTGSLRLHQRPATLFRNITTVMVVAAAIATVLPSQVVTAVTPTDCPRWTSSHIKGTPEPPAPYRIEAVFEDVPLAQLTDLVHVPGTDRWLAVEQRGRLISFSRSDERNVQTAIDLKEVGGKVFRGYSIVFHPEYPKNPTCFICYGTDGQADDGTRVSRFRVTNTQVPIIDPASEEFLISWRGTGHSGGSIQFGPDGYLYISIGDGADPSPPDSFQTGQDISDLGSSILRIDVEHSDGDLPYRIPKDNPFVNHKGARGEVWAFGFRNPWKITFDRKTNTLWAADVGWEMMEMIYLVERGGNYGWSLMEGSQVVQVDGVPGPAPISPPAIEHSHLESRSISGGHFYDSSRLPELRDAYLYGDWTTGKIWALKHDGTKVTWSQELADTNLRVIGFGRDDRGEVLVVGYDGSLHRLIKNPDATATESFPRRLSQTGLFSSTVDQTPSPGVLPYEINSHHFSDHTESLQWVAIPDDATLNLFDDSDWKTGQLVGDFEFPQDSVLAKTVYYTPDQSQPERTVRLETQVLHRNGDAWFAYNYVWNENQTDAVLQDNVPTQRKIRFVDTSQPDGFREQTWHHVSRDQCLQCHFWNASTIHGFKLPQLNRDDPFGNGNQLDRLTQSGILPAKLLDYKSADTEAMVSPTDANAELVDRARSYLHMNCAHCHRRGGGGTAAFELVRKVPLQDLQVIDAMPTKGTFEISDARVIAPGQPEKSVLLYRLMKSGRGHMPQFGPSMIDDEGVKLIHNWIASIDSNSSSQVADWADRLASATLPFDRVLKLRIEATLGSTDGATLLAFTCVQDSVSHPVREAVAQIASRHEKSIVRDLFERFLPADQRVQRLGNDFDLAAVLTLSGDVEQGRKLFVESADVSCRGCHRVGRHGSAVGPDLSGIGAIRTEQEILRSLIYPSEKIDEKYRGKLVLTADGDVVQGMLAEETDEQLVLIDAAAKRHMILQDDIETVKDMKTSVMPDRLLAEFTAQQAADLLAYLRAQKQAVKASDSDSVR